MEQSKSTTVDRFISFLNQDVPVQQKREALAFLTGFSEKRGERRGFRVGFFWGCSVGITVGSLMCAIVPRLL